MNDETTNDDATQENAVVVATPQQQAVAQHRARLQADGSGVMAIIPRDLEEAMRYAKGLALSGIVPDAFRYDGKKGNDINVNLVGMGVLKVLEIGLSPQGGLSFLLPLKGRFTIWGDGAWALLQRGRHLANHTVEWHWPKNFDKYTVALDKWPNEIGCTVRMWREGQPDPYVGEYAVGRARRAGLWNNANKQPWILDPERMLFNRARAYAMRDGFSDDLFGLGIVEEVRDYMAPDRPAIIDNSALDDEPLQLGAPVSEENIAAQAEAYISGLALVPTMDALMEYQAQPNHQAMMGLLQREDESLYNQVLAAGSSRYREIENGERAAEIAEAEAKADAERGEDDD